MEKGLSIKKHRQNQCGGRLTRAACLRHRDNDCPDPDTGGGDGEAPTRKHCRSVRGTEGTKNPEYQGTGLQCVCVCVGGGGGVIFLNYYLNDFSKQRSRKVGEKKFWVVNQT